MIELKNISKSYNGEKVLDDFSVEINDNEFVTLLGPSGCGKTTALRIIAGLTDPDEGSVLLNGKDITKCPPYKRPINMVFQHYALFRHLNVGDNIAFGLKMSHRSKDYTNGQVKDALKLVGLEGYEYHDIATLSGGQQQRVAVARAIINGPEILLLDEPFSALDLKLREKMQRELVQIKEELGIAFVFVTHDQKEALRMSDKIVVMNKGCIQQIGTPEDIYNEPECAFVADFIGDSNIMDGVMIRDKLVRVGGCDFVCVDSGFGQSEKVDVHVRPEDIYVRPARDDEGSSECNLFQGTITRSVFEGTYYDLSVETEGIAWLVQTIDSFNVGDKVELFIKPFNIQIMKKPVSEDEEVTAEE